jgi:hypothetical protein
MQSNYVSRPILNIGYGEVCIERDDDKHFADVGTPDLPSPITEGHIEYQGQNMANGQFGYGRPYIAGSFYLIF